MHDMGSEQGDRTQKRSFAYYSTQKVISEKGTRAELTGQSPICYLCGSRRLGAKFHCRHRSIERNASTYSCTSFGHGQYGKIVECLDCDLVALKDIPNPQELENKYRKVVDPLYYEERESRYITFHNVVKKVQECVPRGKLFWL